MEVILLALFGTGIPSRTNRYHADKLINTQKPQNQVAFTEICFSLGGNTYTLKRKFKAASKSTIKPQQEVVLSSPTMFKDDLKQAVANSWVKNNLGLPNDLLSSVLVSQNNDADFFALRDTEQKAIAEKMLQMDNITMMTDILKECANMYKYVGDLVAEKEDEMCRQVRTEEASLGKLAESTTATEGVLEALSQEVQSLSAQVALHEQHYEQSDVSFLEKMVTQATEQEEAHISMEQAEAEIAKWSCFKAMAPHIKPTASPSPPTFSKEHLEELLKKTPISNSKTMPASNTLSNPSRLAEAQEEYNMLIEEQAAIQTERPRAAKETNESIAAYHQECKELSSYLASTDDHLVLLLDEIDKTKKAIASKEDDNPINQDCWACRQRPANQLKYKLNTLQQKLAFVLPPTLSKPDMLPTLEEHKKRKERLATLVSQKSYYESQQELIVANAEWTHKAKQLLPHIKALKEEIAILKQEKEAVQQQEVYTKITEALSWLRFAEGQLLIAKRQKLSQAKEHYEAAKALKSKKSAITARIQRETADISRRENAQANIARFKERQDALRNILSSLTHKKQFLDKLQKAFEGGLKEYIQEHVVIPSILSRINPILSHFNLELLMTYDKNQYHFFVKDGQQAAPSIERASGFQRFITNLAMRVALSQMGISQVLPMQFIIDEGFTACDADNMSQMPDVMQYFMEYFDTILIISHLDVIRNMAHLRATVKKKEGISKLSFCHGE